MYYFADQPPSYPYNDKPPDYHDVCPNETISPPLITIPSHNNTSGVHDHIPTASVITSSTLHNSTGNTNTDTSTYPPYSFTIQVTQPETSRPRPTPPLIWVSC